VAAALFSVQWLKERFCRRFDRVVSQQKVGTGAPSGNQISQVLNERGPALKVFWSRRRRDGRKTEEKKDEEAFNIKKKTGNPEKAFSDQALEPDG